MKKIRAFKLTEYGTEVYLNLHTLRFPAQNILPGYDAKKQKIKKNS